LRDRWKDASAIPPPRPADLLRAERCVEKDVRVLLWRVVRMSSVTAAREKRSAGESCGREFEVEDGAVEWGVGGRKDEARDWADLEWRREEDGGWRVFVGDMLKDVVEGEEGGIEMVVEEADEEEVEEEEMKVLALDLRGQKDGRCFFVVDGFVFGLAVASVAADDADDDPAEEEDEEKAKEKRDGEPGSPMRMTVPFDAAESGRGFSVEEGGLSFRGDRASRAGFVLRFVRPPDWRRVWVGGGGFWGAAGAEGRTQRSGAE
jgi:hypothetical protein